MIGGPPLDVGAVNPIDSWVFPAVEERDVGAVGVVKGIVFEVNAADSAPVATAVSALSFT